MKYIDPSIGIAVGTKTPLLIEFIKKQTMITESQMKLLVREVQIVHKNMDAFK